MTVLSWVYAGIYVTALHTQRYIQSTWGFCKNADLQPVIPRQSQRFCTSGMLPSEADATGLGPPLWVVRIMLHKAFPSEWTFRAQAQQNLNGISLFCASKKNVIIIRHHRSCFPSVFDYLRDGSNDGLPHLPPIHLELGFFWKECIVVFLDRKSQMFLC